MPKSESRNPKSYPRLLKMGSQEFGNPVIKSPLDTHGYRLVQLKENGLKCLLVSTCIHPRDPEIDKMATSRRVRTNCTFSKIAEFNEKYAGISENDKPEPSTKSDDGKTFKLSKPSKRETVSKRDLAAKASRRTKPQVKCRRGQHEQDDKMQSFCNTKCVGVLYVKAGFHQDPHAIPGMAHFCEHAMSLGSKNYPEIEGFSKFVEFHNGFFNALTEEEDTIYYFHLNYEEIEHAMDMFVDMFAHPIFKQRDLQKEINNINSEYLMKRFLDEWRIYALIQTCLGFHSGFGIGNKASLSRDDIMDQLRHWIKQYYCGENMFFALQGPLSLDELEILAVKYGARIPGRNPESILTRPLPLATSLSDVLPFEKGKWNQIYNMDTAAGTTSSMVVSWALPPKFGKNYATKPVQYMCYILNHRGEGSLDWYLKQKGWITALGVNSPPDNPYFCTEQYTLFCVSADLTAEGLKHRLHVLTTVFAYMKLLQEKKACREIYGEIQQIEADIFHYRSDTNLSDPTLGREFRDKNVTETLMKLLHVLSKTEVAEEVLLSTFLVRNFDAAVLDEFCNHLHPAAAMVVFADNCFAEKATHQEKWFGIKYFTQSMPRAWRTPEWTKHVPKIPSLRFPDRNKFISVSFCHSDLGEDVKGSTMRIEKRDDKFVVYDLPKGRVSYRNSKCQKGLLPSASYTLDFWSPAMLDDTDLVSRPASDVFVRFLEFILDVELGTALSSLISYELDSGMGHVRAILSGPSPKLPELTKKILKVIERFDEHASLYSHTFEDLKRAQVSIYQSIMMDSEWCSWELLQYLLSSHSHFLSDFVLILEESMDRVDFFSFVHDFKRRLYVTGDLNGCVSGGHATKVAKMVDELEIKPYLKNLEHTSVNRCIELPAGERCLLVKAKNREDGNVVVRNYYQVGVLRDAVDLLMMSAITSYLAEASFEELRSVQNLGYVAAAFWHEIAGVHGVIVLVQGVADKHTTGFINERIDDFMELSFKKCLGTQSAFRQNIIPFLDEGEELKYQSTRKFYQDHFLPEGSKFRKVSIQMEGYYRKSQRTTPLMPTQVEKKVAKYKSGKKLIRCPGAGANCGISRHSTYLELNLKDVTEKNGYFITDVNEFRHTRPCFPNNPI